MDLDLLSPYLAEPASSHRRQLLPDLPNSLLTPQNAASNYSSPAHVVSQSTSISRNSPGAVISRIEDIFEAMADCILNEAKELVIQLKTRDRKKQNSGVAEPTKRRKKTETRTITFPSKSPQEAWKFSRFELSTGVECVLIGSSCITSYPGAFSRGAGYWYCYYKKVFFPLRTLFPPVNIALLDTLVFFMFLDKSPPTFR
jgi:hypothetical protein